MNKMELVEKIKLSRKTYIEKKKAVRRKPFRKIKMRMQQLQKTGLLLMMMTMMLNGSPKAEWSSI